MNPEYARLFQILDGCAKRHHECRLTELFPNEESTEYVMCFRSLSVTNASESPFACQSVRINIAELRGMIRTELLPVSVADILDEKLRLLGLR
jgi:hypothetical protein